MANKLRDYGGLLLVILCALWTQQEVQGSSSHTATIQRTERHPAVDFRRHTLVKPKIYHGREKRQISTTKEENGKHVDHLQIALEVDGEEMYLDLKLNKQLIPKGFFHKHQENGTYKTYRPTAQELDFCHYAGKVRARPGSWVALSTCNGLSGVIFDGKEMHYIENGNSKVVDNEDLISGHLKLSQEKGGFLVDNHHYLYKHSDVIHENKKCGFENSAKTNLIERHFDHVHSAASNRFLRYKRSTDSNNIPEHIRGPYNANKESKYVELVLVVDNREFKELGESKRNVLIHCKTIGNIINGLYSPLNIFIALVGVVTWSEVDAITFSSSGDTTLTNFLHYRRETLVPEHPNDNAQLLTKFNFDKGVVGKALKGPICTYNYSGGVNTEHSTVIGLVANTVAHEMGHNFGMEHDTTECKCPEERCIMAPSSSEIAPVHWSSCSLNYLLLAFNHGMDYCLKNKPVALEDGPECGNGFVEPGEQCDCGLPEHCDNNCCNATTCMLHSNASCATGECCDLSSCTPKNAGTLCRSADYECDLPEYCTGQSEYCPDNIFKQIGEECDGGKAFCYEGSCRTRTDQCKLLWGETGKSSDDLCYSENLHGNSHGNCGQSMLNKTYYKCAEEDKFCGMLQCKYLSEQLEFGMETVAVLRYRFIHKGGQIIPCRTVMVDLGASEIDPGLVPNGAKCGEGKMCVNQKCLSVASLRRQTPACGDCNGNGFCNSQGHCHCNDGFAPPFCDNPGPGGSLDSGPASDPNAHQAVIIAMFVIFLGIIPALALIAFLAYYAKYNLKFGGGPRKKSPPMTNHKSPSKSRGSNFPSDGVKKTEDNHSLLREDSAQSNGITNNEFFGNFKGFSLMPLKAEETAEPVRAAPPPPVNFTGPKTQSSPTSGYTRPSVQASTTNSTVKTLRNQFFEKPVQKINSFRNNTLSSGLKTSNTASTVPALPPPNPGSTARPIISSPVLESSTSNAKELVSPLKNALPVRSAPEVPKTRPLSASDAVVHTVLEVKIESGMKKLPKEPKEKLAGTALNRIASFLKPAEKKANSNNTSTLPRSNQVKAAKMDKAALKNLKISDPVPQTDIDVAVNAVPVDQAAKKAVVMRAQSMRVAETKKRTNIQTFGSMRQPNCKRPLSIPSGSRPKSPPPPRPPLPQSTDDKTEYDDCLNEEAPLARLSEGFTPTSGDNIYAVIDEVPTSPEKVASGGGSLEDVGLLGEIVSEIQTRNLDSIYSTSTLARKKKEREGKIKENQLNAEDELYVNTSSLSQEAEYSNMGGSSSTSSGYIAPSAVNVPIKPSKEVVKPSNIGSFKGEETKTNLSSFKADEKPFSSTFKRPLGPLASIHVNNNKNSNSNDSGEGVVKDAKIKDDTSDNKKSPVRKAPTPKSNVSNKTNNQPIKTSPKTPINRQVTPPNLRSRKPSPNRPTSAGSMKSSRSVTNSPDLVTSCSTNTPSKEPDVVGGGSITKKPVVPGGKPSVNLQSKPSLKANINNNNVKKGEVTKPPVATKVIKTGSNVEDIKSTTATGVKLAARSNSNVASLQQKFEEKNGATKASFKVKT